MNGLLCFRRSWRHCKLCQPHRRSADFFGAWIQAQPRFGARKSDSVFASCHFAVEFILSAFRARSPKSVALIQNCRLKVGQGQAKWNISLLVVAEGFAWTHKSVIRIVPTKPLCVESFQESPRLGGHFLI